MLLVHVETDAGEGWGECAAHAEPFSNEEFTESAAMVLDRWLVSAVLDGDVTGVRGFVVLELSMMTDPSPPTEAEDVEHDMRGIDADRFPNISQHFHLFADRALSIRWSEESGDSLDDSFEYLLGLLLDGIAARLPKRRRP